MTEFFLVADVGGTNTRVALARGCDILVQSIVKYRNLEHPSLEHVLSTYLQAQNNPRCTRAAVAIAGPVKDGAGQLTNLEWYIDAPLLAKTTGAQTCTVMNDLQAQGHALGHISQNDLSLLKQGKSANSNATMLVVGIGTGFNSAPVYHPGQTRFVPPSETGHITLAPRTEDQCDLVNFLTKNLGHTAVEDVLSGRGLERCYAWAAARINASKTATTTEIFEAAKAGDTIATQAITAFVQALGGVVGDLALTTLPYGGIFLVGGMSRAIAPWLRPCGFSQALTDKGRFGGFLNEFPIHLIEDDYAALSGCAHFLAHQTE